MPPTYTVLPELAMAATNPLGTQQSAAGVAGKASASAGETELGTPTRIIARARVAEMARMPRDEIEEILSWSCDIPMLPLLLMIAKNPVRQL